MARETSISDFEDSDRITFRRIREICERLTAKATDRKDQRLRTLIRLALANQSPTEYPFLFRYSYANSERDCRRVETIAAAIHLLQTSTFVVDDIFDSAGARNYKKTLCTRYGVNNAIIAGELLQSVALETVCSELDRGVFENKCDVLRVLNGALRDVYIGQYLDIYNSRKPEITTREYYRVISLTTGNFLAGIARCGALLANKSKSDTSSLAAYGFNYGMALQVTDDIVDIVQLPRATGKSYASDLKCRRMRLPLILALQKTNHEEVAYLKSFIRKANSSDAEIKDVAQLIKKCGAVDACVLSANRYLNRSLKHIDSMKKGLTTESLRWLSEKLFDAQGLNS